MSNEISRVLEECFIDEKRMLEEYRELGFCWRHDDDVFSKLTAILLPLAIAALTLPYLKTGAPKLLAAVGGLMLITLWYIPSLNYKRRFETRFSRVHEIERILGFDSHLRYHRESNKNVLKDRYLRFGLFIVYIITSLFVTCDIKVEGIGTEVDSVDTNAKATLETINVRTSPDLWPFDERIIKLVATVETLIVGLVVIVGIVTYICIWIRKRISTWIGICLRPYKRYCYDKRLKRRLGIVATLKKMINSIKHLSKKKAPEAR